jgi:hypothetical protein
MGGDQTPYSYRGGYHGEEHGEKQAQEAEAPSTIGSGLAKYLIHGFSGRPNRGSLHVEAQRPGSGRPGQ